MEEPCDGKDLESFAKPKTFPPGVSMLPLPAATVDAPPTSAGSAVPKADGIKKPGQILGCGVDIRFLIWYPYSSMFTTSRVAGWPSLPFPSAGAAAPPGPLSSDEDSDDAEVDPDQLKADEQARLERKKAGIPVLEHEALPSTIATKMLPLWCTGCLP